MKALDLTSSKAKLHLDEQFKKVEEKIGQDILEKFYSIFTNVPKRIVEKAIDTSQIEKRVKNIMEEEIASLRLIFEKRN